jgi:hypothetical protein
MTDSEDVTFRREYNVHWDDERKCDWCGSSMSDIGSAETGTGAIVRYHVWLCDRDECGHERELPPIDKEHEDDNR